MKHNEQTEAILAARFGKDSLIALATVEEGVPTVRTVDTVYLRGAFYVVTHALSGKMRQIYKNPTVALCGEWFSAHGIGIDLGHVKKEENREIMDILRTAFAQWYGNGHVNEEDPGTILLKLELTNGVLFHQGIRYDLEFSEKEFSGK